jgi:hypothetical protein
MNILNSPANKQVEEMNKVSDPSRRRFFQLAGGFAGAGILFSACHPTTPPTNLYLGSGDTALLNFLYVLEQMEADFYTKAVTGQYIGITNLEYLALVDVRDQEIGHKEYMQALLGTNAMAPVVTNFSSVNFADRTSVLTNAAILEDMVLAGFNGASGLFTNTSYPQSFVKIASVEGRHSSYFRDALTHNNFADTSVVGSNGLNQSLTPSTVLASALTYLTTRFDSTNLPN